MGVRPRQSGPVGDTWGEAAMHSRAITRLVTRAALGAADDVTPPPGQPSWQPAVHRPQGAHGWREPRPS